ncbi:MAG: 4-(cytidine 5'-diphospho)-2-C-methyl-D-erythritol kinase [Chitinophagaceae bacterium]
MISFPNCKINLGLRILRKRDDGYHDLETVFYPLPFYDVLELIHSNNTGLSFTSTGLTISGNKNDNLCVKAYELLKKDFPAIPAAQLHLHKTIPMGAGLGGGSADGAFTLQLLNNKFNLGLSQEQLTGYALTLGSDCPFFIINKPCIGTGRGEKLEPANVDLSAYRIILINPAISIHTGSAFSGIQPSVPDKPVASIIQQPVKTWRSELINDFETTVFKQHPEIKEIKDKLYKQGAIYASMSGSGSTVYGIFPKDKSVQFSCPAHYFIKELQ